jgi:hypothetical protein
MVSVRVETWLGASSQSAALIEIVQPEERFSQVGRLALMGLGNIVIRNGLILRWQQLPNDRLH